MPEDLTSGLFDSFALTGPLASVVLDGAGAELLDHLGARATADLRGDRLARGQRKQARGLQRARPRAPTG
jgi:hypothetical protein